MFCFVSWHIRRTRGRRSARRKQRRPWWLVSIYRRMGAKIADLCLIAPLLRRGSLRARALPRAYRASRCVSACAAALVAYARRTPWRGASRAAAACLAALCALLPARIFPRCCSAARTASATHRARGWRAPSRTRITAAALIAHGMWRLRGAQNGAERARSYWRMALMAGCYQSALYQTACGAHAGVSDRSAFVNALNAINGDIELLLLPYDADASAGTARREHIMPWQRTGGCSSAASRANVKTFRRCLTSCHRARYHNSDVSFSRMVVMDGASQNSSNGRGRHGFKQPAAAAAKITSDALFLAVCIFAAVLGSRCASPSSRTRLRRAARSRSLPFCCCTATTRASPPYAFYPLRVPFSAAVSHARAPQRKREQALASQALTTMPSAPILRYAIWRAALLALRNIVPATRLRQTSPARQATSRSALRIAAKL